MTLTHSPEETMSFALIFAQSLPPQTVILLHGDLGAGKTCFVRGLLAGLEGDANEVHSPTFTLMHEYQTPAHSLVHIDAYRLSGSDELHTIGWDELLSRDDTIIVIEWPKRIEEALPENVIHIMIDHVDETTRKILVQACS
ncbi:MAG: tRNA (adenosine(37)-N6)-threonylcarbamoyltransferase complex ATPase subunit type 1 TsaE [Phycisphaerales bacterium]|nr:tRNA (adenosine(37)-N6)-threonylcarbamoyltransferase complex ATPase subunit type 1 TsaE [Phycisphaerales bacterium]